VDQGRVGGASRGVAPSARDVLQPATEDNSVARSAAEYNLIAAGQRCRTRQPAVDFLVSTGTDRGACRPATLDELISAPLDHCGRRNTPGSPPHTTFLPYCAGRYAAAEQILRAAQRGRVRGAS